MPYLTKKIKEHLIKLNPVYHFNDPIEPGELNFLITTMCLRYLKRPTNKGGRYTYRDINEVMGALECAKQEFYRRVAVPYEDQKIKENGDVY